MLPFLGEGNDNPRQYSCPENPMDRGAWQATIYWVARVVHDLVIKPPPLLLSKSYSKQVITGAHLIWTDFICQFTHGLSPQM